MPVPNLNTVQTQDNYVDALTVIFPTAKPGFSVQIYNASVMYQLAIPGATGNNQDYSWEQLEHSHAPALVSFNDVQKEGLAEGTLFIGIRLRSQVTGSPAVVSVA